MAKIQLHNIRSAKNSRSDKKRVGRGWASNKGKYSGRGMKGQKSRSGSSGLKKLGLRKLMLATPKTRGFHREQEEIAIVNLSVLNKSFIDGETVSPKSLVKKEIVKKGIKVKILANGNITKKLVVKHCNVSASAHEKIAAAGGSVE